MNMVFLIWNYWPGAEGGSERQARQVAAELVRRGHSCTVWTAWQEAGWPKQEVKDGVTVMRLGALAPWQNRLNVWVQDVDDDATARCVTADETRSVYIYRWTDNPRWMLYMQDSGGDENWHVYRVDLENPDTPAVDLTPFPGTRASFELPKRLPGKAIVQINKRNPDLFDVFVKQQVYLQYAGQYLDPSQIDLLNC